MKTDPRRFAPLGLVLSLLAFLAFIGFILVRGLSSAGIFTTPDPQLLERGLWISASAIILGLALTAILDPESTRKFLVGRQVQYGSNSVIMFLAFVGILIFINILAYQNPKTWDLTEDQTNTLTPETINALKTLPTQVTARAYYTTRNPTETVRQLLDNFKQNSDSKFDYVFLDPEQNPVVAQQDGVERDGTVVLLMGDRKEQVSYATEQDLVSALVRLINPENRVVYFVTGHGEPDLETQAENSYTMLKATLEKKNYTVKPLGLRAEGAVPADATVVVVAGPQTPLAEEEIQSLQTYMANGGALIVMEEPLPLTKFGEQADTLAPLLAEWGLSLNNDFVIDPNANPAFVAVADPLAYGNHPVSEKMRGLNSLFPSARSIRPGTAPDGITLTPLAVTRSNAWGETSIDSIDNNQVAYQETIDTPGPVILAIAGENFQTKARLVVFGDAEFPADALYQRGNGDLFINAVDWVSAQENLISITPKNATPRTFNPPGTLGLIGVILTSLCLLPLLVIAGGFAAWYSRRRRG